VLFALIALNLAECSIYEAAKHSLIHASICTHTCARARARACTYMRSVRKAKRVTLTREFAFAALHRIYRDTS